MTRQKDKSKRRKQTKDSKIKRKTKKNNNGAITIGKGSLNNKQQKEKTQLSQHCPLCDNKRSIQLSNGVSHSAKCSIVFFENFSFQFSY